MRAGIVPWRLVVSRSHFALAPTASAPGASTATSRAGTVRDNDGSWKLLDYNVRTPSGISYVSRTVAMPRRVPACSPLPRAPLATPPAALAALRASPRRRASDAVWTPGR